MITMVGDGKIDPILKPFKFPSDLKQEQPFYRMSKYFIFRIPLKGHHLAPLQLDNVFFSEIGGAI